MDWDRLELEETRGMAQTNQTASPGRGGIGRDRNPITAISDSTEALKSSVRNITCLSSQHCNF